MKYLVTYQIESRYTDRTRLVTSVLDGPIDKIFNDLKLDYRDDVHIINSELIIQEPNTTNELL